MSKTDQLVSVILVIVILLYLSVFTIAIVYRKISFLSLLNLISALSVLIYWIQKQFRISFHIADPTEIAVLCFEIAVIGVGIYSIVSKQNLNWISTIQKIVFGIHLSALILFLVFMLTFKITKLF
jgi:hypothetical protein